MSNKTKNNNGEQSHETLKMYILVIVKNKLNTHETRDKRTITGSKEISLY